jgi:hypothetical protein
MTTLQTVLAAALIAVTCAACSPPAPDDRGGGTVTAASESADLAVPPPTPCTIADTALCIGNGLTFCTAQADGSYAWQYYSACDPEVCIISTTPEGYHRDFCALCRPGATMCDSGRATRMTCGTDYQWHDTGRCPGRCDCGGTYPHCKLCQ